MPKLTYWVAAHPLHDALSVRARTKERAEQIMSALYDPQDFEPIKEVTVEYDDAFDLLEQCMSDVSGEWEI